MVITLTPCEEQLLQALSAENGPSGNFITEASIRDRGTLLFGDEWGGKRVRHQGLRHYPVVNRFLGRLLAKGLVEREAWNWSVERGHNRGLWRLSPLGRELLGLSQ